MSNTPSNPDYPNSERLAGLIRAFDRIVIGKQEAHVINGELGRVNAQEQLEALKEIGINEHLPSRTSHAKRSVAAA